MLDVVSFHVRAVVREITTTAAQLFLFSFGFFVSIAFVCTLTVNAMMFFLVLHSFGTPNGNGFTAY